MIRVFREQYGINSLSMTGGLWPLAPFDGVENQEDVMYATTASGELERVTKRRVWLPLKLPLPLPVDDEIDMMCAGLDVNVVKIVSWRGGYGMLAWRTTSEVSPEIDRP